MTTQNSKNQEIRKSEKMKTGYTRASSDTENEKGIYKDVIESTSIVTNVILKMQ